ncbi:MAG: endonuclease domain-containing protein [Thiolinea sp.]
MTPLMKAKQLRQDATYVEKIMWNQLRSRRLAGYKFRRQYPIGQYIVDFVCYAEKLIVEVDGEHHHEPDQIAYDRERTRFFQADGYQVMRFTNQQIIGALPDVLRHIEQAMKKAPRPQGEGLG